MGHSLIQSVFCQLRNRYCTPLCVRHRVSPGDVGNFPIPMQLQIWQGKKKPKSNRVNKKADAYISRSDHRYKETLSKIGSVRVRLLWTGPSGELCVKGRDLNDIKEQTTKRQSVRSKADSKRKDSRVRMVGYHIRRQARRHCGWV